MPNANNSVSFRKAPIISGTKLDLCSRLANLWVKDRQIYVYKIGDRERLKKSAPNTWLLLGVHSQYCAPIRQNDEIMPVWKILELAQSAAAKPWFEKMPEEKLLMAVHPETAFHIKHETPGLMNIGFHTDECGPGMGDDKGRDFFKQFFMWLFMDEILAEFILVNER